MPPNAAEVARPKSPLRAIMPQSPLRIKQDGKFYERLLAKEKSAAANRSFRHYWATEPVSVPFVWESQPGTPKDVSRMVAGTVQAITPPPSYLLRQGGCGAGGKVGVSAPRRPQGKGKTGKTWYRFKRIKIGFLARIFRRLTLGQAWRRSAPSVQVSSSSSRWLFSSVATSAADKVEQLHHEPAPPPRQNAELSTRARPSPWMLRFRGFRSWSRDDGWA